MTKPILVYTMEKVGSTTVMRALESAGFVAGRAYPGNINSIDIDEYSHIITMVRDPIARNLSQYWEREEDYSDMFPDEEEFVPSFPHQEPEEWFDKTNNVFSADIMQLPFNKDTGWQIYGNLLVIRTESLTFQLSTALAVLLMRPATDFTISHRAKGAEKFGAGYADYLMDVGFDEEFLDRMYSTEYVKHFYTPYEISSMKKRWRK